MLNSFALPIAIIPLVIVLLIILKRIQLKELKTYDSPISGTVKILERSNGERFLSSNYFVHGISTNTPGIKGSYWENIAKRTLKFCEDKQNPQVLMLGLGANTISSIISRENPSIQLTIVEIDPVIIQACEEFFNLKTQPNTTIIQNDVFKLIDSPEKLQTKFDVVIIDIFSEKPPFISLETGHPEFVKKLKTFARPDGLFIFNRINLTKETAENVVKLEEYLKTSFNDVQSEMVRDSHRYKNCVITARM